MSRIALTMGWLVWILTIAASATINYLSGYGYGRTPVESQVFAVLGAAADIWKALGPIFIITLVRHRRILGASLAGIVWCACFTFAVGAALGLAAQNRSGVVGAREGTALSYKSAVDRMHEFEQRRARIDEHRDPVELDRAIDMVLARPIEGRGTVATLSDDCNKDHWRKRHPCAEVVELRATRARAVSAAHLDAEISELRRIVDELRNRGGNLDADPQSQLIARLTGGHLQTGDVGLVLILITVAMIEVISAFAPVVLHEYATTRHVGAVATGRDAPPPVAALRVLPDLYEFLASRVLPDGDAHVLIETLHFDFQEWCQAKPIDVPPMTWFIDALDEIVRNDLHGRVNKTATGYKGFRLRRQHALLATSHDDDI